MAIAERQSTDDRPIAVYVHFGQLQLSKRADLHAQVLMNSMLLTMSWGTPVTLISDSVPESAYLQHIHDASNRRGGAPFTSVLMNCTGCSTFRTAYDALHGSRPEVFKAFVGAEQLRIPEYRNEVRYIALRNFMRSTGHASIVHLDSDAALLATAHEVFHPETYRGCDAVITWGQVSGRTMPIHPRGLDAYWAGTARLNLPVLESYVDAIQAFYSDPRLRRIQVEKQLSLPTYNDMTSWCLFTILHGGGHLPVPPSLLSELRASSIAWQMTNQHRVCNTQPHSFDRLPGHGIVQSASAEINPDIIQRVVTQGQKPKFFISGTEYVQRFRHFWNNDFKHRIEALHHRDRTSDDSYRLFTVHGKTFIDRDSHAFLSPAGEFGGRLVTLRKETTFRIRAEAYAREVGLQAFKVPGIPASQDLQNVSQLLGSARRARINLIRSGHPVGSSNGRSRYCYQKLC